MNRLLLWGAGGHAKVVLDCALMMEVYDEIAFIDDAARAGTQFCGHRVLGSRECLIRAAAEGFSSGLISVGENKTRAVCFELMLESGLNAAKLVHRTAIISPSATVGPGTVVMPGVIINAEAQIGRNCIINTGAVIEHDCIIGDHAHISPAAVLGGGVTVGAFAHLGLGAIALPGAKIGDRAVVGAGAVVLRSVPEGATVAGVPARLLSQTRT